MLDQDDKGVWTAERAPEPLPTSMRIDLAGGFLLGVAGVPGDRDRPVAYFRDGDGELIMRLPRADRESALYQRLSASAVTGETAEVLEPGSGARRASSASEDGQRPAPGERAPIGDSPNRPGGDEDDGFTDPGIF